MFKFSSVGYKCGSQLYLTYFFFSPQHVRSSCSSFYFFLEIFSCHGLIRSKNHGCLCRPPKSLCDEDQTRSHILCTSCSSLLAQRNMPRTRFASPIPQPSCSLWNFHGKYRKDTIFYSKENGTNETTYGSAHKYPFQGEVDLFADQSLCLLSISFWIARPASK